LQGRWGVARAVAQIEAQGGRVVGREITVEAGGVRARPDLLVQRANGDLEFVEVKTGSSRLTANQQAVYPRMQLGGAVPGEPMRLELACNPVFRWGRPVSWLCVSSDLKFLLISMKAGTVSIVKTVFELLTSRLAELGFKKRKAGIFTLDLTEDAIGWIGLNTATGGLGGSVELNPIVGLRNQRVERLVADLNQEPFHEFVPATVSVGVGYLSPLRQYAVFLFSKSGGHDQVAARLVQAIQDYGLPFIRRATELHSLVELMQSPGFGIAEQLSYRIPAALLILGERVKARDFVEIKLRELESRSDPAALRYRAFGAKLLKRHS